MVGGGRTVLHENFHYNDLLQKRQQMIFDRGISAISLSEKKFNFMTNTKSTDSSPMSLRWTAYVAPNPQRGLKTKVAVLGTKFEL